LIATLFGAFKNCFKTQDIKAVDFLDVIWMPKDAGLLYSPNPETVQKYLPSPHLAHAPV
jgi:hypothetical protein